VTPGYHSLFSPLILAGGDCTLPNRVVITAMVTRVSGEDGFVNRDILDRYVRFAEGGAGMVVIEAMAVHDYKSGPLLRISRDEFVPGLRELALRVRAAGECRVFPQIIHFLKISRSGWRQTIHDLSKDEIRTIVRQYADAAARSREAGFDGVELHMAHAYTVSSFLSKRNKRPDEYGGTLENRMRLMTEILQAVRERVGPSYPVGVRFDGEEGIADGYGLTDSREIALRMARLGAAYVSISAGGKFEDAVHKPGQPLYPYTGYSGDLCMPPATYQDAANAYLAADIRAHLRAKGVETPIVVTGKIREPGLAERILARGDADLIGLARTALADPDWPRKARDGREDRIVRCLCINVCKALDENFKKVRCYFWPKGELVPPRSVDGEPPRWPPEGAGLEAERTPGAVILRWRRATDNEAVYGYDILRSEDGGPFKHLWAVRGDMRPRYEDGAAAAGGRYAYVVRAYDLAGNRSEPSNAVEIDIPLPVRR
jgi:2,4-dienoyl-CoA reductase-like NADH-dependent reductase (Old Yellow Enzyme family)